LRPKNTISHEPSTTLEQLTEPSCARGEGASVIVYEYDGTALTEVLSIGCGA
jgi:hypothetical protein